VSPWLVVAALSLVPVGDGGYLDAPIVTGAKPLDEPGRYESPRTFDDTLTYYKYHFKSRGGVRWRNVVNLPHIRAQHIQSLRPKTKWQGLNVYEQNGRVRIFVVPRTTESPAPAG
jgi:hypothetical protein